jgi:hypothetical protein
LIDGGVRVDLSVNDKFACSSNAIYGTRNEGASGGMAGGMAGVEGGHSHASGGDPDANIKTISSMTRCEAVPIRVKKGDTMRLTAIYDLSKHPLRVSGTGKKAADVMGMMGVSFTADK